MTRKDAPSIAIIMDGNARWATERGLPVLEGHRQGAQALKRTVRDAVKLNVAGALRLRVLDRELVPALR